MRYTSNKADADDIFQQAFYLVYKNLNQLKNLEALSGWIKSVFVNAALAFLRTKKQVLIEAEDHSNYDKNLFNINDALGNLEAEEMIHLIQKLPEGCRAVFNLYVIDGFKHKEIAEQLNISIGTSKSQLHEARYFLKKWILSMQDQERELTSNRSFYE